MMLRLPSRQIPAILYVARRLSTCQHDQCNRTTEKVQNGLKPIKLSELNVPVLSATDTVCQRLHQIHLSDLSPMVLHRSKRALLDTIGVGLIGTRSQTMRTMVEFIGLVGGGNESSLRSSVWGRGGAKTSASMAAFVNGASIHSMDFDDTWYPPTHPSGPVLAAVLALAEAQASRMTGGEVLVAYNVGLELQGRLLQCSQQAAKIPTRLHPPAVVGVMGSAAACARLLNLSCDQFAHSLAIAASFAGGVLANAGTEAKPLHCGKSARLGLEAALLAKCGMAGAKDILDTPAGFPAFFDDFDKDTLVKGSSNKTAFLLEEQDIAFKRYPAHIVMHWAVDATKMVVHDYQQEHGNLSVDNIERITIKAPRSKYIHRQYPSCVDEARHSLQFNVCKTIMDGDMSSESFSELACKFDDPLLNSLLARTHVMVPEDNAADLNTMYINVCVALVDGSYHSACCDAPYGHWRNPLSQSDLEDKFMRNAMVAGFTWDNAAILRDSLCHIDTRDDFHRIWTLLTAICDSGVPNGGL